MNPLIPAIIGSILGASQEGQAPAAPAPLQATRPVPEAALKAMMEPPSNGYARFDGNQLHLAPGSQIRDTSNRIVMPGTVKQPVAVRYLVDARGEVFRVWILTPAEAARSD